MKKKKLKTGKEKNYVQDNGSYLTGQYLNKNISQIKQNIIKNKSVVLLNLA